MKNIEYIIQESLKIVERGENNTLNILFIAGLFSQLRVLIESNNLVREFPAIGFYSNWLLHPNLDRNEYHWAKIKESTNSLNLNLQKFSGGTLTGDISSLLSARELRQELLQLSTSMSFSDILWKDDENWRIFVIGLYKLLISRRLCLPKTKKGDLYKDKIITKNNSQIYAVAISIEENDAKLLWCLHTEGIKSVQIHGYLNSEIIF